MGVYLITFCIISCDGGDQRSVEDFHERVSVYIDDASIDCGYVSDDENYEEVIECISQAFNTNTPFFGSFESEIVGGYIGFSGDSYGNILVWKDNYLNNYQAFVFSENCTNPALSDDIINDPQELFHCDES